MLTHCTVHDINQAGIKLLICRSDNCAAITNLRGETKVKINNDDSEYIVEDFKKTEKIYTMGGTTLLEWDHGIR